VQPNQSKVSCKKRLTEKPTVCFQEKWEVDCERRRLLTGDWNGRRAAGAQKKAAKEAALVDKEIHKMMVVTSTTNKE
jgi:hypothetical protein